MPQARLTALVIVVKEWGLAPVVVVLAPTTPVARRLSIPSRVVGCVSGRVVRLFPNVLVAAAAAAVLVLVSSSDDMVEVDASPWQARFFFFRCRIGG